MQKWRQIHISKNLSMLPKCFSHNQSWGYFIFFPSICSFLLKLCGNFTGSEARKGAEWLNKKGRVIWPCLSAMRILKIKGKDQFKEALRRSVRFSSPRPFKLLRSNPPRRSSPDLLSGIWTKYENRLLTIPNRLPPLSTVSIAYPYEFYFLSHHHQVSA